MKNKRVTNREKVKEVLDKIGHRLSIDEVSHLTGLTKTQVRNTANYYDSDIVPIGGGIINLLGRAYKGRGLRITPTKDDIRKGIICSDELFIYLWAIGRSFEEITLFSKDGVSFNPKREYGLSSSQSVIGGFREWYRLTKFQEGDDIIFKCHNLKNQEFEIFRLPSSRRDEEKILHQINRLGEMIYDMLKYSINKYEQLHFLARKYLLRDIYLDEILPDQIMRALSTNPYLLIFEEKYRKVSYLSIGIKKYFHYHKGTYHTVSVVEDEIIGKYGYCEECESFMKWDKKQGWRPAKEEEYFGITLDNSFFKRK